jgi:hypothetical protein
VSIEGIIPDKYQVVVLDCAYDTWGNPQTRELLMRTLSLKLHGYLSSYPYGTLPIDTTDFICTHLLICEKRSHELLPVMGYKCTTLDRANTHRLALPCQAILQSSGAERHHRRVLQLLDEICAKGRRVSYDGSWTLDPEIRNDEDLSKRFKDVLMALNVLHHLDAGISDILGFGVPRFKTDQFFRCIGYERVSDQGGVLPEIQQRSLQDESVVLMHLQKFSDIAMATGRRFRKSWDNRIEIADLGAAAKIGLKRVA